MDTIGKLADYGAHIGSDIRFMGVPKTIDNDLMVTDHTPGYGSAAKYIGVVMKEIIRDATVYGTKYVTIVEIMGRNAGWLTAAAALAKAEDCEGVDMICLPEVPFNVDHFVEKVERMQKEKPSIVIAVSEGVKLEDGRYVCELADDVHAVDAFGHKALTGTARFLANTVARRLDTKTRCIELSTLQRCAGHLTSRTDITEAYQVGGAAAKAAFEGHTGEMVALDRISNAPYQCGTSLHPISEVANLEKKVPLEWVNADHTAMTDEFLAYAREENLEATVIATVTEDPRMVMTWNGDKIVNLSREFLASNGASKHQTVHVEEQQSYETPWGEGTLAERMNKLVTDINVASNKGLSERFDSTIGAGTVLMPFGGKRQLTPNMAMVAKLPVFGETTTASAMAWGFNPYIMSKNQFTGAYLSVVESLAKLVAAGFEHEKAYLSFQEYFEKLRDEPERWGKPAAAVLGALMAQVDLGAGAIGGKDSMSGSFEDLDVPPTLISFAVAVGNMKRATSPEFKDADHRIVRIAPRYLADGLTPDKDALLEVFSVIEELTDFHDALAVSTPGYGATAEALFKMTLGNRIGVTLNNSIAVDDLFTPAYGSFIVELADDAKLPAVSNLVEIGEIGTTTSEYVFKAAGETLDLDAVQEAWESGIESVFPYRSKGEDKGATVETIDFHAPKKTVYVGSSVAKPHVVIPVFPGNNCEYDSAAAFERAGADVTTLIINNLTPAAVAESTQALVDEINKSQIVMIPGGFSGGDEPDGSAKFITAFFRAPAVTEAVRDLLKNRDGLMLGICNGFQALVKLGLVPYGDIVPMTDACPTLTFNTIGRHQSRLVRTRVASDLSPWLSKTSVGDIHTVAISHGEGRFVASDEVLAQLRANGQIATQYVDETGTPGMDLDVNPNGSLLAIEGITSPDGRVFGKMGHSERSGNGLYVNVPGNKYQPIFEAGVEYFAA